MLTTQRSKLLMKIWFSEQPSCKYYVVNLRECTAGNPGSNPGPGENFSLKLTT